METNTSDTKSFGELLKAKWDEGKFVCVGLDSEYEKIPACMRVNHDREGSLVRFNRRIVRATHDMVCAYKPNLAFYLAYGWSELRALQTTMDAIREELAPGVPIILDMKSADIGNTNEGFVKLAFDVLKADAVTVNPYLGGEALKPFLERTDKGIIVVCRTSNPGAGEFQDVEVEVDKEEGEFLKHVKALSGVSILGGHRTKLFTHVAYNVAHHWNRRGNCSVVVGATCPEELAQVRRIVGDMPMLIPGVGAQGGDLESTVRAGMDSKQQGVIINSSRGIIFASSGADFADRARSEVEKLHDAINEYRKEAVGV